MEQLKLFEDETPTEKEPEVFDWIKEFPDILDDNGKFIGFDVVIGNPPYIGVRTSQISKAHSIFYKKNYETATGQFDAFSLFIELSYKILSNNGLHSYIISKRMVSNENFEIVRTFLLERLGLYQFTDAQMPFHEANVETNIIFAQKNEQFDNIVNSRLLPQKTEYQNNVSKKEIELLPFKIFPFFVRKEALVVLNTINNVKTVLGEQVKIIRGFEFGFNHQSISKKGAGYKVLKGKNIGRYFISEGDFFVDADFSDNKTFKKKEHFFTTPKLLTRFVSNKLMFAYDTEGYCNTNVVYNIIKKTDCQTDLKYLLGLLNSDLINFWFYNTYSNTDKIFPHIQKNQLAAIPIAEVDKKNQNPIIKLVDQILILKKKAANADTSELEKQIDAEVYKIYGLSEDGIKVIKNGRID